MTPDTKHGASFGAASTTAELAEALKHIDRRITSPRENATLHAAAERLLELERERLDSARVVALQDRNLPANMTGIGIRRFAIVQPAGCIPHLFGIYNDAGRSEFEKGLREIRDSIYPDARVTVVTVNAVEQGGIWVESAEEFLYDPDSASEVPRHKANDWPEDFEHENGRYTCSCCVCGVQFVGHKRRVVCKVCALVRADQQSPVAWPEWQLVPKNLTSEMLKAAAGDDEREYGYIRACWVSMLGAAPDAPSGDPRQLERAP